MLQVLPPCTPPAPPLQYYALEVSYFKSALDARLLDALWSRHWVATLAASPLLATRALAAGQLADIGGGWWGWGAGAEGGDGCGKGPAGDLLGALDACCPLAPPPPPPGGRPPPPSPPSRQLPQHHSSCWGGGRSSSTTSSSMGGEGRAS